MSLSPGASRVRLVSALEESLRLSSLPGEEQGRVYYFRRIRLAGLPANGDRTVWLQHFQHSLSEQAASAIHGASPAAAEAYAVYFQNHQEACEILLRRILERRTLREWFWTSVIAPAKGLDSGSSLAAVPAVIEQLRQTRASWVAVAETVFAVLVAADPLCLVQSILPSVAEEWLREIGGWHPEPRYAPEVALPGRTLPSIARALRELGAGDPRVLWLAALAVVLGCPSDLGTGAALARARLALKSLSRAHAAHDPHNALDERHAQSQLPTANPEAAGPPEIAAMAPGPAAILRPEPFTLDGEKPTAAGGLFFLLNTLTRVGIAPALASGLAWEHPQLVVHILRRMALRAGVPERDPVVVWLALEAGVAQPDTTPAHFDATWWPSNLPPARRDSCSELYLVRAWCVAARRWCWRMGKISAAEIIRRDAMWSVNRTDLDVALPLDSADIRVRRIGLDLDPGWLPWFGRVVRFHYRYLGEARG